MTLCLIMISHTPFASNFGVSGLIDLPSARMSADGQLTLTSSIQSLTNSHAITYQPTPRFETTFRYTKFNDFLLYDRNYEIKFLISEERDYLPQLAVGIRDLVGTGIWSSEYLVASKKIKNIDFTLGLGWGRLSGDGHLSNPLTAISGKFENRVNNVGSGGKIPLETFFSGKRIGIFGGFEYNVPDMPLRVMAEYNPDNYDIEFLRGVNRPRSRLSFGLAWDISKNIDLSVSRQHDQEWGIEFNAKIDTKFMPNKRSKKVFTSSLDLTPEEMPPQINTNQWYDLLLYDSERLGLLLLEASLDDDDSVARIVMGNTGFDIWTDALSSMLRVADLHLPSSVRNIELIMEEEGFRFNSIKTSRSSLRSNNNNYLYQQNFIIKPASATIKSFRKTSFISKKVLLDVNIATRFQFFDPDDTVRRQLYLKIDSQFALPKDWLVRGTYGFNITNNFDEIKRVSDSSLPRVRSDIAKYLSMGDSGVDSLLIERRKSISHSFHYRVYAGILESMYSGIGSELLYLPFRSRVGFGLSAMELKQRDFDKGFGHLDYRTFSGFLSIFWASPFHNIDFAIHTGKYLAKDFGATLELRRTFHNGWMIGAWMTKTNVSSDDFGEGSFDKGLFFQIPLSKFTGNNTRSRYSFRMRPIQRDGGQRLEDFSGNIWWMVRSARFDAIDQLRGRLAP